MSNESIGTNDFRNIKDPSPWHQVRSIFHPTAYTFENMQKIQMALMDYSVQIMSMQDISGQTLLEYCTLLKNLYNHYNHAFVDTEKVKILNKFYGIFAKLREIEYSSQYIPQELTNMMRMEVAIELDKTLDGIYFTLGKRDLLLPIKQEENLNARMERVILQTV